MDPLRLQRPALMLERDNHHHGASHDETTHQSHRERIAGTAEEDHPQELWVEHSSTQTDRPATPDLTSKFMEIGGRVHFFLSPVASSSISALSWHSFMPPIRLILQHGQNPQPPPTTRVTPGHRTVSRDSV